MTTAQRERSILEGGAIEVLGRMPWSSNATFLVRLCHDNEMVQAVYKPHRGEQWLWDFPDGLFVREVAAYELSEALGWGIVPVTIIREDAPAGRGSLQLFVDADFAHHYFTLLEDDAQAFALRRMATFDLLANNADRKGGHCLLDEHGHIWGVDHGLCFHVEPKLRTVMWDFAGESIPSELIADIARFELRGVPEGLAAFLGQGEVEALMGRVRDVMSDPVFPFPHARRSYPWPMV